MSAMKPDAVDQLHHDHVHLNRLVEAAELWSSPACAASKTPQTCKPR